MKEALVEALLKGGFLRKQEGSVLVGTGGGSSAVAISFGGSAQRE